MAVRFRSPLKKMEMLNGFTLTVGTDVYDWSLKSRLRQFEEKLKALKSGSDSVIPLMKEAVEDFTPVRRSGRDRYGSHRWR